MRLKKVKDAKETVEKSNYYISEPEKNKGKWQEIFGNQNEIHIEIGMGKGKFIIGMALANPNVNYIGIEKYDSVLVKAVKSLEEMETVPNLKLLLLDAEKIEDVFENEVSRIYLNFSDPWPKSKHAKRRLTSHVFLEKYDKILKDSKEIYQKTDNREFFDFSCESLKAFGYELEEVTYDLEAQNDASNITTEYEEKFQNRGIKINRLKAHKN